MGSHATHGFWGLGSSRKRQFGGAGWLQHDIVTLSKHSELSRGGCSLWGKPLAGRSESLHSHQVWIILLPTPLISGWGVLLFRGSNISFRFVSPPPSPNPLPGRPRTAACGPRSPRAASRGYAAARGEPASPLGPRARAYCLAGALPVEAARRRSA